MAPQAARHARGEHDTGWPGLDRARAQAVHDALAGQAAQVLEQLDRDALFQSASSKTPQKTQNEDARAAAASLRRTRDLLARGLDQVAAAAEAIEEDSSLFSGVLGKHSKIGGAVKRAGKAIRSIKTQEDGDLASMVASVCVFYLVVFYIIWRRLPLRELMRWVLASLWGLCFGGSATEEVAETAVAACAAPVADARVKWLDWSQYLRVVDALREECAALDKDGRRRSPSAVAWSVQRYLIFGILSCVPDRQRTVRELEIGRTLFRERVASGGTESAGVGESQSSASGKAGEYRWVIRHGPDDYKTGRDYGVRPPMVIHPKFYPALEDFVANHRHHLGEPAHGLLFSTRSGAPLRDKDVHRILTSTSYRLTGKRVNPHLVRDMIITHLRGTDASERELEALAIYMGHSLAMQKGTYDRRTKEEKVAPAIDLLDSVNAKMRA
ncbi:hypothetical protein [uncultured Salinisphaera sp.]|uniref:hypothetical protein n=1 Tax=uncultured Salinisphaera sp. TaxID=359372 RepID=UPI0032B21A89